MSEARNFNHFLGRYPKLAMAERIADMPRLKNDIRFRP